jgi:uncharacterized alkaline shock family protein YloU
MFNMTKCDPCDPHEYTLPDTTYSRDIENKVFRGIIIKTLSQISGIGLVEGGFFESLIGNPDRAQGITTVQDPKNHSLKVKIEVSIQFGVSIPEKAEEIQNAVVRELTAMTGIHVAEVHVVFKELFQNALLPQIAKASSDPDTIEPDEFEDVSQ